MNGFLAISSVLKTVHWNVRFFIVCAILFILPVLNDWFWRFIGKNSISVIIPVLRTVLLNAWFEIFLIVSIVVLGKLVESCKITGFL
jgi:hypothetical protein